MARISTEKIVMNGAVEKELDFKYNIDVSKGGIFSTMLPKEIVERFQGANIDLNKNLQHNPGYVSANTLNELTDKVKALCTEYLSREVISQTIVLKYGIETRVTYAIGIDGDIYPNGTYEQTRIKDDNHQSGYYINWKNGTINIHAASPSNFGILVYCYPYRKEIFKYKSGKEKTEYSRLNSNIPEDMPNLKWLSNLNSISPGSGGHGWNSIPIQEIIYSESVGIVFVNLIKSICSLNEKIKDFLTPEAILKIAEGNQKLIG